MYDTDTWTQTSPGLDLREQLDSAPDNLAGRDTPARIELTNYGLALSADG